MLQGWRLGEILERAVAAGSSGVTVADSRKPDMPLVYANESFYKITGYTPSEVLGRNCRFLQGERTNRDTIKEIRDALTASRTCNAELLNYTKAGQAFWNRLTLVPLPDDDGGNRWVVGFQTDVTEIKESEVARQQLIAMSATMRTVNDVVLNFMNNLQLYRLEIAETGMGPTEFLDEFDSIFDATLTKLSKINSLTKFKSKSVARGITVLDME